MACLIVKYVRSLNHLQHANLTDHGLCVDLAHVVARVITLDIPDVQLPGVVPIVGHSHPWVVGYHVVVDCQDGFAV